MPTPAEPGTVSPAAQRVSGDRCSVCAKADWLVSVIVDGKRVCGRCERGWMDMAAGMRARGVLI
jgi:hypothetical protein